MLKTQYVYFQKDDFTFFVYDSYSTKAGSTNTFSGIYTEFNLDNKAEFTVYKKDWADSFLRWNKKKTGINHLDRNLTIVSKKDYDFNKWFDLEFVNQFLELSEKIVPLKLIVRKDYLPLVNTLKNKSIIGLETNQWLYKTENVSLLLMDGTKLIKNLLNFK